MNSASVPAAPLPAHDGGPDGAREEDASPALSPAETARVARIGRMLRLLSHLPASVREAMLVRTQRPTFPARSVVDRDLVSRERVARADRTVPGVPVTWIDRPRAARAAVIHLHGGAYTAGERPEHWRWLEELRRRAGTAAAMVHYRMPPHDPFPGALDDAVMAISDAVERAVVREGTWVLSGDSAGGGLALAVLERLHERGALLPAGLLLTAPWTDLTMTDPLQALQQPKDRLLTREFLSECAQMYRGEHVLTDPRISPRFGSVHHLPPVMLVAGGQDLLLGDARALRAALEEAEVPVAYHEQPDGPHDYPIITEGPAAQWVLRRQIAFVREACGLRD